jgi:hypothetical protein
MTHRDPLDPAHWPLTSPHWAKVTSGAQLADLVRLEALLRFGGFYLDSDCEPFRPLDPLLGAEVVAAWEDERTIPNAVLGARPDHPAIRECLVQCIASLPRGTWEAGPGVTTRVLGKRDDVLVLPPGSFYPGSSASSAPAASSRSAAATTSGCPILAPPTSASTWRPRPSLGRSSTIPSAPTWSWMP